MVKRENLEDVVHFCGYIPPEELPLYYSLCDVYIMPSRELRDRGDTEGFGITYLEANACEKPVVGGRSGGVEDAIVDGVTGFLVDPLNSEDIADALIRLLGNPELSAKMGRQGRSRILEGYTWHRITENMLNHFKMV